jgi:hypothetical protein
MCVGGSREHEDGNGIYANLFNFISQRVEQFGICDSILESLLLDLFFRSHRRYGILAGCGNQPSGVFAWP